MTCKPCQFSENGHTGIDCPMRKIGIADKFSGGCNLQMVKHQAEVAEKKRIDSLPDVPFTDHKPAKEEKILQNAVEGWLANRGYRRINDREIAAYKASQTPAETRGWFYHLHETRKNGILPDLMIFNRWMTACLMLELKVRKVYQPGQLEAIESGIWQCAFTFDQANSIVREWESCLSEK